MLRKYHDVCPLCNGEGQLYLSSQDELNSRMCPYCSGIGVRKNYWPGQRADEPDERKENGKENAE